MTQVPSHISTETHWVVEMFSCVSAQLIVLLTPLKKESRLMY